MIKCMKEGTELREDYHEVLVRGIKNYYLILRIFTCWILVLSIAGTIGMIYSFFTDESINSGLFQNPVFKWIMMSISGIFMCGIVVGAFVLFMLPIRNIRKAKSRNYHWKYGTVTQVWQKSSKLWIDDEEHSFLCTNLTISDSVKPGEEFIVVVLNNAYFAIRP